MQCSCFLSYRDCEIFVPSALQALIVMIYGVVDVQEIAYPVLPDVFCPPNGSTGIDLRYFDKSEDKSTQQDTPPQATVVVQPPVVICPVHAEFPSCHSAGSAALVASCTGRLPPLSITYVWIAVRIFSTSALLRASRASASRFAGFMATKTVTAIRDKMTITINSSISVKPRTIEELLANGVRLCRIGIRGCRLACFFLCSFLHQHP